MIAETTLFAILKGTLTLTGSAWAIAVLEGEWTVAVVAAPAVLLCSKETVRISRRLRGKRAEGPP